jgi:DNA-binding NarL/FixJ family response regulator
LTSSLRLVLVHEDPLYRECLAAALAAHGRFAALAQVADAEEARAALRDESPDVLLVQWDMRGGAALDLARYVASSFPKVAVILLGLPETYEAVRDCAEAGGAGYILKGESLGGVLTRITEAVRGEIACSPRIARFLFAHVAELARYQAAPGDNRLTDLTSREMEILTLIADDLSNKEIAARLYLSLHTVKNHVHSLLEKLAVESRHAAIRYAHQNQWRKVLPGTHPPVMNGLPSVANGQGQDRPPGSQSAL